MKKYVLGTMLGFFGAALLPVAYGATNIDAAYQALDRFGEAFERVRANYIRQTDDAAMVDIAISGMVASLDAHSSYQTPAEVAAGNRQYAVPGLNIVSEHTLIKVLSPIDGGPAAVAGVKAGDYIAEIDGKSLQGVPLSKVNEMLRGPERSNAVLTILRKGEANPLKITVTRAFIRVDSVKYERKGQIGYIKISSFPDKTDAFVQQAVSDLKREIGDGLTGFILDLRNNPGGLLDQSIAVADEFLTNGEIVSMRGRAPQDNKTYTARGGDIADGKPIIVLGNENTAGVAEIVAGALQENHRAIVLGSRTLGYGTLQTLIPVGKRREALLRLTTAEYYFPSGRAMESGGVEPDIAVSATSSTDDTGQYEKLLPCCYPAWSQANQPVAQDKDNQLQQALMRLASP